MKCVSRVRMLTGLLLCGVFSACAPEGSASEESAALVAAEQTLDEILAEARRVPNSTGWFEIVALPNDVYALWEPGHQEKVNSFFIVGESKDVLYDTGMGIGSISRAVEDLRREVGLPERELMVVNSHNHLDHNAGNVEFDEAWIFENDWAIEKLTQGLPAGSFTDYWAELTPHEGVTPPEGFDPATFSIPPFPREGIRFLADGDVIDLGNRQFRVVHTTSHSPDGIALYSEGEGILFGGDTFIGDTFLIRDPELLVGDLTRAMDLQVEWHYCSHGPQLIEVMRSGFHLEIVRRMLGGERTESTTQFAGQEMPVWTLEGVVLMLGGDFLTY